MFIFQSAPTNSHLASFTLFLLGGTLPSGKGKTLCAASARDSFFIAALCYAKIWVSEITLS